MKHTVLLWVASELPPEAKQVIGQLDNFEVEVIRSIAEIEGRVHDGEVSGVFLTLPVDDAPAATVINLVRNLNSSIAVVIHDPHGELAHSTELTRTERSYCVFGHMHPDALARAVKAALKGRRALTGPLEAEPWRAKLVGDCPAMQRIIEKVRIIAPRQSTVLITGDTGTGKEVIARAIHMASLRTGPMVAVNCSALPETLLEAELFGHVKGAFTGATDARIGRFEQAHQGTIFLDEIGDLPLETQGKLLRVLQEHEIQRIGSSTTIKVDARVVAATNVDLCEAVSSKKFREDLFYRLSVVPVHLPPLSERVDDIPLLVCHFLEKLCGREGLPLKHVSPAAIAHLCQSPWPGNVRQLEHAIETAIVLSGDRSLLEPADFAVSERRQPAIPPLEMPAEGVDFEAMMSQIQRFLLNQALEKAGGNKSRAAEMLQMKRSTLVSKVKTLSADSVPNSPEAD